jgi:SSS family solute:Na+ symporter
MKPIDFGIVLVYLLFVLTVGVVFRRSSKTTSDYFRAGGAMPWWITGASAWIAGFSAWTFTGAAGKVYETGLLVLVLYYGNIVGLGLIYFFMSTRFRRMRVTSWMEGVRHRFGPLTENLYTWIKVPLLLLFSGVGLNAIGIFIASVTHIQLNQILIVLGVVVTLVSASGGAMAILASDFVQMFLVVTITLVVALLTLNLPQIGGLTGLLAKVPPYHFHWTQLARPEPLIFWSVAVVAQGVLTATNMESSPMYLMSKSDRDARRMVLIPIVGSLISPLIWFIPPMAATILHPNLAAEFPALKAPHEAAFVAVAMQVMPTGLIGLLMSAMLGATLTSMDAGVNKGAGVFVRSFYLPRVKPNATEQELLKVSKVCTLMFGAIIVLIAIEFNAFRTNNLFDLVNQLSASLSAPLAIPLVLGLLYKRTPSWSAWSTALVGFACSLLINGFARPEMFQQLLGYRDALSKTEATDMMLGCTVIVTFTVSIAWFFFTTLFYERDAKANRESIEEFFTELATPVIENAREDSRYETGIYSTLGRLCCAYGCFVLGLILIPNSVVGRLCFAFCGGAITCAGMVLLAVHKSKKAGLVLLQEMKPA